MDYYNEFRLSIGSHLEENDTVVGGEGIVVQIDNASSGNGNTIGATVLKVCGF